MKKLLVVLLAAGAGYLVWRNYASQEADRELWAEVTEAD